MKIINRLGAVLALLATTACGPSLETLKEGARSGKIQTTAPLLARRSVVIAAPPERVFAVLGDVSSWPRWQPNVSAVTAPKSLAGGERFTWTNGGTKIESEVAAVEPNALLAWTGTVSVAKAVHVWRLSPTADGSTTVDVEESMDGPLLTWFYGQKDLEAEMDRSLGQLRTEAESPRRTRADDVSSSTR